MFYWKEDKEITSLRWEYLLRSEEYKEFCMRQRAYEGERDIGYISFLDMTTCGSLFLHFGDIHSKSFDDYWEEEVSKRALKKRFNDLPVIRDFDWNVREYNIGEDIDYAISQYEEYAGIRPSIEELKKGLIQFYNGWIAHGRAYIVIRHIGDTISDVNEVTKEIGKILKKRISKKRFVKEELERYLKVYDMRTEKPPITYREIHNRLYPRNTYTENTRRARVNDFNKAKRIIQNVEDSKLFYW